MRRTLPASGEGCNCGTDDLVETQLYKLLAAERHKVQHLEGKYNTLKTKLRAVNEALRASKAELKICKRAQEGKTHAMRASLQAAKGQLQAVKGQLKAARRELEGHSATHHQDLVDARAYSPVLKLRAW